MKTLLHQIMNETLKIIGKFVGSILMKMDFENRLKKKKFFTDFICNILIQSILEGFLLSTKTSNLMIINLKGHFNILFLIQMTVKDMMYSN